MTTKPGPRVAILSYLAVNGLSVLADIMTGIHEPKRERVQSNLSAAVQDDLVARKRDDVSNQPAYEITTKGKNWLTHNTGTSSPPSPKPSAVAVQQLSSPAIPSTPDEKLRASHANELALTQTVTEVCCALGANPGKTTTRELVDIAQGLASAHVVQQATVIDLRERLDQVTQRARKSIELLTEKNRKLREELEHLRANPPAAGTLETRTPTGYAVFDSRGRFTRHKHIDTATLRAARAVRAGAHRADVAAIYIVSRAKPGVQIKPA